MSQGPQQPKHGSSIAATAAILMLAGFSTPIYAAPDRDTLCDDTLEATLDIPADTMSATIEAVADDHLLKPRVEATARKVFADDASESEAEDAVEIEAETDDTAAPRLRSFSDKDMVPFKRQMYRKDI